jgi:hypothetical protein
VFSGGSCLEAEEEAAEDGLDAEHEAGGRGQREAKHALGGEVAEAGAVPDVDGVAEDAEPISRSVPPKIRPTSRLM